jgi:hypothetical protein
MNEHMRRFDNSKWQSNPLLKNNGNPNGTTRFEKSNVKGGVEQIYYPAGMKVKKNLEIEVVKTPKKVSQAEQMRRTLENPNRKPSNGLGVGM